MAPEHLLIWIKVGLWAIGGLLAVMVMLISYVFNSHRKSNDRDHEEICKKSKMSSSATEEHINSKIDTIRESFGDLVKRHVKMGERFGARIDDIEKELRKNEKEFLEYKVEVASRFVSKESCRDCKKRKNENGG